MARVADRSGATVVAFPLLTDGKVEKRFPSGPRAEVDTVGVTLPVREWDGTGATVTITGSDTPEEARLYRKKLDGGGFAAWGVGDVAWLEASLPKRGGDGNVQAVGLEDARELLGEMVREASGFLGFDDAATVEGAKVVRLDLVRDFDGVRSAPFLLDGLANVRVPGRAKKRRFADTERNRAETYSVGPPRSWLCTLYDKAAETAKTNHPAPEGRVRFEVRMRSDVLSGVWARNHGGCVRQVGDIQEEKVQRLRRGMFERVGFDREVSAPGRLAEVVLSADELTAREKRELWAYLTLVPHGGELGYSRPTERKYRRMAEDLGVVMLDPGSPMRDVSVSLDYDGGREVMRVA